MAKTNKIKNNTRKSNKSELNLNVINQANENLFNTKEIEIIVGDKPYSVKIDQNFRTTKIEKMIKSLVKSENLKQFGEMDESVKLSYYFYLIIKEFSNLDIPDNLSIEEEINLISNLIDLGVFEKIIAEISEDQIMKVNDYLQKFNINLNEELEEINKNKDENKDVENFAFGNVIVDESGDLIG